MKKHNNNTSLESTNTRLTGNIKLVLDESNQLFIESINSTSALNSVIYKGYQYDEFSTFAENIKHFIETRYMSAESLYAVKPDNTSLVDSDFSSQLSSIYKYGCYSEESQLIDENLRFFAPIYLKDLSKLPDKFIIFNHSDKELKNSIYHTTKSVIDLLNSGRIIKIFDLTKIKTIASTLEESFIYFNFDDDKNDDSVIVQGLDYLSGLHVKKQFTGISEILQNETTFTEFNNTITNFFQNVNLLFSSILNLEFAFTDTSTDGFSYYSGVYVTLEEVSSIEQLRSSNLPTKFIQSDEFITFDVSKNDELKEFFYKIGTSTSLTTGINDYQKAIIKFKIQPEPYSSLTIHVNDVEDYKLILTPEMIGSTISKTLYNIVEEINMNFLGEQSSITAEYTSKNELVLFSKHLSDDVITVHSSSSSIQRDILIYTDNPNLVNSIRFKGSNTKTFVTSVLYDKTRKIIFQNKSYTVTSIYQIDDKYYYEVDETISLASTAYFSTIHHYAVDAEKAMIGHLVDHSKLDTSTEKAEYFDILDFDIDDYKQYLLNRVYRTNFVGSANDYFGHQPSDDELCQYKEIIINKINTYFNQIAYSKNYLINNINIVDKSSDDVQLLNPFERLKENDIVELRSVNRLHQFIQKWRLKNATDSFLNPYLLNVALSIRSDNFSSSILNYARDLREHTMHWFIIGSGQPPYFNETTKTTSKLSYTKSLITEEAILDKDVDFYNTELTIFDDKTYMHAWSNIEYDQNQETCFVFFRGVKYKIDDKTLNGYRFSVIMKSDDKRSNTSNDFDIDYLRNDVFKTFTIILYFYIPEPILTTLEGDIDYFVDRTLLYFSSEIYASKKSQIDFGESTISLDLFNTISVKSFSSNNVGTNWLYETGGKQYIYIKRGNISRFTTSFKDILSIDGEDFKCSFTGTEDMSSPYYGMEMIFSNIVEIQDDAFWCETIILKTVTTHDIDGIDDDFIDDNVVDNMLTIYYSDVIKSNPLIIQQVNLFYISKYIAYELFMYNKIVSSSANNNRYLSITLANFASTLDLQLAKNPYNISVIKSDGLFVPITLQAKQHTFFAELTKLDQPYFYPMYRYEGKYIPSLISIYEVVDEKTVNYNTTIDYKAFKTVLKNQYIQSKLVQSYEKEIVQFKDDKIFSYLATTQNATETYLTLPWGFFPIEVRNFLSICFNSEETISIFHKGSIIEFADICKEKFSKWLNLSSIINENENDLKSFYKYSIGNEISRQDILTKSYEYFIKNVFLKIYRIKSIVDEDQKTYNNLVQSNSIQILGDNDKNYIITFSR